MICRSGSPELPLRVTVLFALTSAEARTITGDRPSPNLLENAPVEYATAANRKGNERVPNSYARLSGLSDARQPFGFHAVMIFATAVTRNS